MTAEEFYNTYKDKSIGYGKGFFDSLVDPNISIGICIGFDESYVLLEPSVYGQELINKRRFYPPLKGAWRFSVDYLIPLENEIKDNIVLYPIKCKKCQSPARKCDGYIFCSNAKCKTRKQIKYINNKLLNKINSNFVICPMCQDVSNTTSRYYVDTNMATCRAGHNWFYSWQNGDKVLYLGVEFVLREDKNFYIVGS